MQHTSEMRVTGLMAICVLLWSSRPGRAVEIIRPKVLVVATYETGQDRGDVPGELQYWVERQKLETAVPVPGLDHPLLTNGSGLYAMVSGTTSRCAVQMMALAMNPAVDLTHTYILLSGIGGADPAPHRGQRGVGAAGGRWRPGL